MPNRAVRSLSQLMIFVLLAYALSWVFWLPAALLQQDRATPLIFALHTLGGFGPSIAGILLVCRGADRAGRADFWRRAVSFRRLGWGWTLGSIGLFPLSLALATLISALLRLELPAFDSLRLVAAQPVALLVLIVAGIIGGPLAEELGWRGYALDRLQARWGVARSIVILGVVWWAWHLPLFLILGTTQQRMGVASVDFLLFFLNIFATTALIAWIYNRTRGSILSAILKHFGFNFALSLAYPIPVPAMIVYALVLALTAIVIYRVNDPARGKPEYTDGSPRHNPHTMIRQAGDEDHHYSRQRPA